MPAQLRLRSFPAVRIAIVEPVSRVGDYAERHPGWVTHHPPRMRLLHSRRAEALKPLHLSVQVAGVDVHVHAGGSVVEALYEQPELLAVQLTTAILGIVEPRERLSDGTLPERDLAAMVTRRDVDYDSRHSAVMRHDVNLHRGIRRDLVEVRRVGLARLRQVPVMPENGPGRLPGAVLPGGGRRYCVESHGRA